MALSSSKGSRVDCAGPIIMRSKLSMTCWRSASWPHHHVAIDDRISSSPRSAREIFGRKARKARVSRMPEPSALTAVTEPRRIASARPGVPMLGVRAKFQRIGESGVHAPPQHADRLEAGHGANHQPAVGDGQVLALQQHDAEIAGDIGVFEIGLVERPRRQDGDAAEWLGGHGGQRIAEPPEEAGQPVDMHVAIDIRQGARRGDAVFQREAGAGRRLHAVAQHPPFAIRPAAEFEGAEMQEMAAGRLDAGERPQIFRARRDQAGRQDALLDQPCWRRRCRRRWLRTGRRAGQGRR